VAIRHIGHAKKGVLQLILVSMPRAPSLLILHEQSRRRSSARLSAVKPKGKKAMGMALLPKSTRELGFAVGISLFYDLGQTDDAY